MILCGKSQIHYLLNSKLSSNWKAGWKEDRQMYASESNDNKCSEMKQIVHIYDYLKQEAASD